MYFTLTLEAAVVSLLSASAGVAQLVEQLTCNQQVAGSTPIASSILLAKECSRRVARVAKGGGL